MRLNKHISDTGTCSRREADRLIAEGRVTVNGIRARVGSEVGDGDTVMIDGQALQTRTAAPGKRRHVYIALHKPVGITCTTETSVKGNIVDFVDHRERIFPIGRLDKDSEGLILMTSNGDIVNKVLRAEEKKGPLPTGMVRTGLPNQPEEEVALAFAVGAARTAVETALDKEDFAAAMSALAGDEEFIMRPMKTALGEMPVGEALIRFHAFDVIVHRWDLARSQGVDARFTDAEIDCVEE